MEIDSNFDEKIVAVIRDGVPAKFKKVKIAGDTRLQVDLGLDSLAIVSLVFQLEKILAVDLSGDDSFAAEMSNLRTVDDLVGLSRRTVLKVKK